MEWVFVTTKILSSGCDVLFDGDNDDDDDELRLFVWLLVRVGRVGLSWRPPGLVGGPELLLLLLSRLLLLRRGRSSILSALPVAAADMMLLLLSRSLALSDVLRAGRRGRWMEESTTALSFAEEGLESHRQELLPLLPVLPAECWLWLLVLRLDAHVEIVERV